MITISSVVESILKNDIIASESLKKGILNLSQYSLAIHEEVEKIAKKPVKKGSIVVALSRIQKMTDQTPEFIPDVSISHYSVMSDLCEITYEKTRHSMKKLTDLDRSWLSEKDYFALSVGISEITLIFPKTFREKIINHFGSKPKIEIGDLAAITVGFPETYMSIPNTIFSLVYRLACSQINIIEIISTYTEIAFIVHRNDVPIVLEKIGKSDL